MDTSAVFLTEKEERALRRMSQLTELRRSGRAGGMTGRDLLGFVAQLVPASFLGYVGYSNLMKDTPNMVGVVMLVSAMGQLMIAIGLLIYQPMQRRIDALAQLLEDEIKRSR